MRILSLIISGTAVAVLCLLAFAIHININAPMEDLRPLALGMVVCAGVAWLGSLLWSPPKHL